MNTACQSPPASDFRHRHRKLITGLIVTLINFHKGCLEMSLNLPGFQRLSRAVLGAALLIGGSAYADDAAMLEGARKLAVAVPSNLSKVLVDEMSNGGVASAVDVCNVKAPQMAKAASEKTGWAIRRVSLKNRNPKAVPDAWERAGLEDFDRRAAAGEDAATLEKFGMVETGGSKEFRYMKALPVQEMCLACHGTTNTMAPEAAEKIHTLYPGDLGTGYSVGQMRGAITLRKTY
jgi:hypothetical protein